MLFYFVRNLQEVHTQKKQITHRRAWFTKTEAIFKYNVQIKRIEESVILMVYRKNHKKHAKVTNHESQLS